MADNSASTGLLKNPPLKEVIFELHWELEYIPGQNFQVDNGFEEAVINFTNACQQGFKVLEILKSASIPYTAVAHKITHRFFKEKGKYPLYQLGPGVFTVNDNDKNYKWEDFEKLIVDGVSCLRKSYIKPLVLGKIELRYVDAVSVFALGKTDKFSFLKNHLNINVEGYKFVDGSLEDINFKKRFSVNGDSYLNMMVATGIDLRTKEESIIWHTFINNKQRISWDDLPTWIGKAHKTTSLTFKKMLSDELFKYFN